ncbi:hypothetical protein HPB47_006631, partial [Ixodes persulcatus]
MLPHDATYDETGDAQLITQRTDEARQLARLRLQEQLREDARRGDVFQAPTRALHEQFLPTGSSVGTGRTFLRLRRRPAAADFANSSLHVDGCFPAVSMSRDILDVQSVMPTMEISTEQTTTSDRGNTWHLAPYRNGKLRPISATAEGLPVNGVAFLTKGRTFHAKKRLEPLQRGGFKIVMRPRDGMDLGREMSYKIQIQINNNQNILAVHTEVEETARALTRMHQLTLAGKSYPSYTYLAAPDDSIKGVIHDVKPGSTTQELLDFIRALITLEGRKLPSYVIYSASRQRVLPYRLPRHICARCLKEGHKADVRPTPNIRICTQCATQDPTPDHACTSKCLLCDVQRPTGDRMCQRRYNDHQSRQNNTTKRTTSRKNPSRSRARSRARQSPASESREKSQGRSQTPQKRGRTPRHRRSQTSRRQSRIAGKQGQGKKPRMKPDTPATGQGSSTAEPEQDKKPQQLERPKTHQSSETEIVLEWAKALMNMLTCITSRVDRIEQQLMSPEMELKSPTPPPAQPEDAQQTIARLQETIACLQKQLRAATEKEQIETVKRARKTDQPTRTGNSVSKNTCPDQALIKFGPAEWTNTEESLGSDHWIIEIEVAITALKNFIKRHAMTDWDGFRKTRFRVANVADDLERWVRNLQADVEKHTKHVNLTSQTPEVDSRLLHLWEAKRSLLKRWKRQRLNRKLKLRIARLEKEALEHAEQLGKNNWHQKCNELQGTLGTAKTWLLLRHLMDPSKNKSQSSHTLRKILHDFPGKNEEILRKLKDRYIGSSIETDYPDYNGEPNTENDGVQIGPTVARCFPNVAITAPVQPGRCIAARQAPVLRQKVSEMPMCCAVGCSSRYEEGKLLFRVRSSKRDVARRKQWLRKISRKNFTPSGHARLSKDLIFDLIRKCESTGLTIDAIITDMGPGNQGLWRECGITAIKLGKISVSCEHPCASRSDRELYFLADAPHILKNLRGHLVRGQHRIIPDKIVQKHNLPSTRDGTSELKLAPRLKERHLDPSHYKNMSVAWALAVKTHRTRSAIRALVKKGKMSS